MTALGYLEPDDEAPLTTVDELAVDLIEWLEHEEIGCALSDDAIRTIRDYMRRAAEVAQEGK